MVVAGVVMSLWVVVTAWLGYTAYRWGQHLVKEPSWRTAILGAGQLALFCWFMYWGYQAVTGSLEPLHQETLGIDGRLYYRAAATFLAGGDPWTAASAATYTNTWPPSGQLVTFRFTGPPPTVLAFVPLTLIPEEIFVPLWIAVSAAAGLYSLKRIGLPMWWILFPPMLQGIAMGNPHVVCLALLLAGSDWVKAIAAPVKAYAVFPLVGERRWRALLITAGLTVGSMFLFWSLWFQYLGDYSTTNAWLLDVTHGGFSAARDPRLFAVTAVSLAALAIVDFRAAGWLATPGLFPAAQYFYASFILPVRSVALAIPIAVGGHRWDAYIPWTIVAYCWYRVGWAALHKVPATRRAIQGVEARLGPILAAPRRPGESTLASAGEEASPAEQAAAG